MRKVVGRFGIWLAILAVVLLAIPGVADLLRPGFYTSHDGVGHVIRMQEFYKAIQDGHFPVRWSGRLYFGYGYPFFNFNYPSIYYLGVPMMTAGMSAADAMKGEMVVAFIVSGILMFLYLRRRVDVPYAVLGASLYLYAPYRMSNIYVRGSVAEAVAFIFPPLLLWAVEAVAENRKRSIFLTAILVGGLGVSHNISALLLAGMFFGYLLFWSAAKRSLGVLVRGSAAFIWGILIASFFLVPALYEKKWTFLDLTLARDYPDHFVYPFQFIKPGWGFGASVAGPNDGMSFNLGWMQMLLAVTGLGVFFYALARKVKEYREGNGMLFGFSLLMIVVSTFFMLSQSKFIWDRLPLLPFVQFPWRFTLLAVPMFAVIGSLGKSVLLRKFPARVKWLSAVVLIGVTLFLASNEWHRNQTVYVPSVPGDAISGSTTWAHEQATRWLVPKPDRIPAEKVEGVGGMIDYQIIRWKTAERQYAVVAQKNLRLVENTMYYPGWKVWVDGQETGVDYQNSQFPGRLVFPVTSGEHMVVSKLTETPLRETMDLVSLISLLLAVLGLLLSDNFLRHVVAKVFAKH